MRNERYGDMFEFGVVDPTKVVRRLQNAASVACLLLTTDSIVVMPKAEEDDHHDDHHDGGGMGGMGGMGMGRHGWYGRLLKAGHRRSMLLLT